MMPWNHVPAQQANQQEDPDEAAAIDALFDEGGA